MPLFVSCERKSIKNNDEKITNTIEYTPFIGPYLTLIKVDEKGIPVVLNPAENIIINYESRISDFKGKVRYKEKKSSQWIILTEDDFTEFSKIPEKVHHITISNLKPDTIYDYQIFGNNDVLSQVYSFKTTKNNLNESRFLLISDMQNHYEKQRWKGNADKIYQNHLNDFDFILCLGDMTSEDVTYNNERYYWWKVFFDDGKSLFASKVIFPVLGNHDTPENTNLKEKYPAYKSNAEDTLSFRKYFYFSSNMNNPDYYSFSFGNSCFIAINSEIPVFYGRFPQKDTENRREQQFNWIKNEIDNNSGNCKWSFAYSHVTPVDSGEGKKDTEFIYPYLSYLNKKIDWYFAGHVHFNQRLRPFLIKDNKTEFKKEYGTGFNQGTGLLIIPPAGQHPRKSESQNLEKQTAFYPHFKGISTYETGFSIIQTNNDFIKIRTYGTGDTEGRNDLNYNDKKQIKLIDEISYNKNSKEHKSEFPECFYTGTSNNWKKTYMILTDDNVWETTVFIPKDNENYEFKFYSHYSHEVWYGDNNEMVRYMLLEKWYGDNEPFDNKAYENEETNIKLPQKAGTYKIKFNDYSNIYSIEKIY